MEQRFGPGGAAGNIDVDRNHLIHAAAGGVVRAKDAAADAAGAHGDDQPRIRCGIVRLPQRQFHVPGDRAGHQEHIRVPRGGHEVNAETLDVVNGIVQGDDLQFAAVAGARVHFADGKRTAQHLWMVWLSFSPAASTPGRLRRQRLWLPSGFRAYSAVKMSPFRSRVASSNSLVMRTPAVTPAHWPQKMQRP